MPKLTIIKDAIYGFIHVNQLCKVFLDTPEFERLRRIKQLGLAHFVYPSATHTRFEHCLGVMHLAGKVADKLSEYVTEREKELLQLAGLLHDVGHVAFSHLFDYILEEQKVKYVFSHHEYRSIFILKKINDRVKLLTEQEVEIVSNMILGNALVNLANKPFLYEIVNNKEFGVDVDRLDYLQRDMYHTGSPCFQPNYILECIGIQNNRLSLRRKALPEVEMMYECRKRLLLLICRHKTVIKAEYLMREAVSKLGIFPTSGTPVVTVGSGTGIGEWFEKNWLKLDDYRIHCMMEDSTPEILVKLDSRDWPEIDDGARLQHVSIIDREDIDKQIKKVRWID